MGEPRHVWYVNTHDDDYDVEEGYIIRGRIDTQRINKSTGFTENYSWCHDFDTREQAIIAARQMAEKRLASIDSENARDLAAKKRKIESRLAQLRDDEVRFGPPGPRRPALWRRILDAIQ